MASPAGTAPTVDAPPLVDAAPQEPLHLHCGSLDTHAPPPPIPPSNATQISQSDMVAKLNTQALRLTQLDNGLAQAHYVIDRRNVRIRELEAEVVALTTALEAANAAHEPSLLPDDSAPQQAPQPANQGTPTPSSDLGAPAPTPPGGGVES